jgi:hypothetical protein
MGIKIDHSEIKDATIGESLVLYFPYVLDLSKNVNNLNAIQWMKYWGFRADNRKDKTIVIYPHSFDLKSCFYERESFDYIQSLNKDIKKPVDENDLLNLIISKSLISMGAAKSNVSIIEGVSESDKSIKSKMMGYKYFYKSFSYKIDKFLYEKDFNIDKNIKEKLKNNKKENFYNDFHIINSLNSRIIFLKNDFDEKSFSYVREENKDKKVVECLNVGRVKFLGVDSKKENSTYNEVINQVKGMFSNLDLCYNVISGIVLSSPRGHNRKIDLSNKDALKKTPGYVFSEVYLKLKNEGIYFENRDDFNSNILQYNLIKSKWYLDPSFLLNALFAHCNNMNEIIYNKKFNLSKDENVRVFLGGMLEDLCLGMNKLGMFQVKKIGNEL